MDTFFSDGVLFACFILFCALMIMGSKHKSGSSGDGGGVGFDTSHGGCDGGHGGGCDGGGGDGGGGDGGGGD
ncbi:hypothetical protein CO674_15670 [Rhizobium hidalgonense]|uniref:Uncharacterized protein n=1 Tax=Rhizobium hidalgonense TaxID=1538159 RepID=A0ABX4JTN7_9HYPH|nr:hypothetical protein CO674_15670 [Rhizobium hidalgonense]